MKGYLCMHSTGEYDDYHRAIIFFTENEKIAKKWCTKFNKMIKKWKEYYSQFTNKNSRIKWIEDEFIEQYYERWYEVKNVNKAWYEEIEIR